MTQEQKVDWERLYIRLMQEKQINPEVFERLKDSLGDEWDEMMEYVTKSLHLEKED